MPIRFTGKAKLAAAIVSFALIAAGGVALEKLQEDRFTIETVNVSDTQAEATGVAEQYSDESAQVIDGKVNINNADSEVLTRLDGIGEKTADKIIKFREEHGDFESIEELVLVPGIGEKKLDAIREHICVD